MKRTPLSRKTPLRRVGERSKREAPYLAEFRRVVLERARGRCQRCGKRKPLDAHRMRLRSRGLPLEDKHDPRFGAALCGGPHGCHDAVHDHTAPDWRLWIL